MSRVRVATEWLLVLFFLAVIAAQVPEMVAAVRETVTGITEQEHPAGQGTFYPN